MKIAKLHRLPKDTVDKIDKMASSLEKSKSYVVEKAVETYYRKFQKSN